MWGSEGLSLEQSNKSLLYRWSLEIDRWFHSIIYCACDYLSVLELKLNHVSKSLPGGYVELYWHMNMLPLPWRHNEHDGVSNHQPQDCLLERLFRRRSKKTLKLCVTGLCVGNSPGTGEFPAQMASNAENVSIWWRHHACPHPIWPGYWFVARLVPSHHLNRWVLINSKKPEWARVTKINPC